MILVEMRQFLADHPDAKIALDQLKFAAPWFDTFNTVAVRKAMGDQVRAIRSGKVAPAEAVAVAQRAPTSCCAPTSSKPRSRRLVDPVGPRDGSGVVIQWQECRRVEDGWPFWSTRSSLSFKDEWRLRVAGSGS